MIIITWGLFTMVMFGDTTIEHSIIPQDTEGHIPRKFQDMIEEDPFLVIEVTKESFWKISKKELQVGYADSPANIFCPERWKHIKFFILIQPNIHQLYIAANLQMPHYHLLPSELEQFRSTVGSASSNKIRILSNTKNHHRDPNTQFDLLHENDTHRYVTVINNFTKVETSNLTDVFFDIQLDQIANIVYRLKRSDARGNLYFDYGTSADQNQYRSMEFLGCTMPRKRSQDAGGLSSEEEKQVINYLEKLSILFVQDEYSFLVPATKPVQGYFNTPHGIRDSFRKIMEYDSRYPSNGDLPIARRNIFPRGRCHLSSKVNRVQVHCDHMNPKRSSSAMVASFTGYVLVNRSSQAVLMDEGECVIIRRTGMHTYGCEALERQQGHYNRLSRFINVMVEFYHQWDTNQKDIGSILFERGEAINGWHSFPKHSVKSVGLSCLSDAIIRFCDRCDETIFPVTSKPIRMLCALALNTIACESPDLFVTYLDDKNSYMNDADPNDHDSFGFTMYQEICKWKTSKKRRATYFPLHQPTHNINTEWTVVEYKKNLDILIQVVMYYKWLNTENGREVVDEGYHSKVLHIVEKNIKNVGSLLKHHILYVMSMLGLVPLSVLAYAEFASTSINYQKIARKFPEVFQVGKVHSEESYRVLVALAYSIKQTVAVAENCTCAFTRRHLTKSSTNRWVYAISPKQESIFFVKPNEPMLKLMCYRRDQEEPTEAPILDIDFGTNKMNDDLLSLKIDKNVALTCKKVWTHRSRKVTRPREIIIRIKSVECHAQQKFEEWLDRNNLASPVHIHRLLGWQTIFKYNAIFQFNRTMGCHRKITIKHNLCVVQQLRWWTASVSCDPLLSQDNSPKSVNNENTEVNINYKDNQELLQADLNEGYHYIIEKGTILFRSKTLATNHLHLNRFCYQRPDVSFRYLYRFFTCRDYGTRLKNGNYMLLKCSHFTQPKQRKMSNQKKKRKCTKETKRIDVRPHLLVIYGKIGLDHKKVECFFLYPLVFQDSTTNVFTHILYKQSAIILQNPAVRLQPTESPHTDVDRTTV